MVPSSWIDMLAGLSRWVMRSTPPAFCAEALVVARTAIAPIIAASLCIVSPRCRAALNRQSVHRTGQVNNGESAPDAKEKPCTAGADFCVRPAEHAAPRTGAQRV